MLNTEPRKQPIDPPYPRPWEVEGLAYQIGGVAWLAGLVLLLLGLETVGLILMAPGLVWLLLTLGRTRGLRFRALDGLEMRAPSMTERERERELDQIAAVYGGKLSARTQRRIAEIRAIPEKH